MTSIAQRFPALRYRDFRLLWFGQIVSISGSQMQNVAIAYEIYQRTGSEAMLGMLGLARVIPIVIFSLVGGAVADGYPRRGIMMLTQGTMMVGAIALGMASTYDVSSPAIILSLTALTAAAGAFNGPAQQALMPNLVSAAHFPNAVSLSTIVFQFAMIVGPSLSGLVIAGSSVATVYWINAATFLAVLAALLAMRVREVATGAPRPSVGSVIEGLRFVKRTRIIWSTMLLDFFATFFATATALLPVFAKEILKVGPEGLGLLYAAEAVGSLVAGLLLSFVGDFRHKGAILLYAVAIYGAATLAYGFSTSFFLSLFLLGLVGAGDSVSTVIRQTIRQLRTPDKVRGRMTSVNMIFFMGGPQLGNLEAGLVAALIGAPMAVVTGGAAVLILVALMAWRYPVLRRYS